MKNKSYIGISFIILVFGIIFIPRIINRIKEGSTTQNDRLSSASYENDSEALLAKMKPVPSFELTNQNNVTISNKNYIGKVYVLEFFFSFCPSICPIMNKNMVTIQNEFSRNPNFGIASITIDPKNDTPSVLKEHAKLLGATSKNWQFLTGDEKYILDLSNKGFNIFAGINENVNGGFEHSGLFALVDKKGMIRCRKDSYNNPILYYDGLSKKGVKSIIEDIKLLLKE
jgi:protein SCO1/2